MDQPGTAIAAALRVVRPYAARCLAAVAALSGVAQAQVQRTFVNLGFELPSAAPSTCFFQIAESAVPGWTTNHPSQSGTGCAPAIAPTPGPLIEIWTSGFNGVTARLGQQFAELNAEAASRIYQNVCLATGEPIGWRFSHRGRNSATTSDVTEFRVGSTAGTHRVVRAATQNDGGGGVDTCYGTAGADAIQGEIERRLKEDATAVACYLDLDNLKAFNDYYGYAKANAVIRQTGDVIRHVVTQQGGPGDFIGHIAGDDFVFITSADRVDQVCMAICERFDHLIRLYYDPADREAGYIETKDRFGVTRKFPIMSVSIAAIALSRAKTYATLAELAATGKRAAKGLPGSSYVRDGQTIFAVTAAS